MSNVANYAKSRRGQMVEGHMPGDTMQLTAACDAGILVTRLGATAGKVKAPATAGEAAALDGAVPFDSSFAKRTDSQTTDHAAGDIVQIVDHGPIYLYAETAMTRGTQAFVRYATGAGGTELGVLRNALVSAETALAPGVRVKETTTGAGPVLVELNLPATGAY